MSSVEEYLVAQDAVKARTLAGWALVRDLVLARLAELDRHASPGA